MPNLQPILDAYKSLQDEVEKGAAVVRSGVSNLNEDQLINVRDHLAVIRDKAEVVFDEIETHLDDLASAPVMEAKVEQVKPSDPQLQTKVTTYDGTIHTLLQTPPDNALGDAKPAPVVTPAVVTHAPTEPGDAFSPVATAAAANGSAAAEAGAVPDAEHATSEDAAKDAEHVIHASDPKDYAGQAATPPPVS